jgi:glycosyltransferase involved in cell wall biosynthesis
MSGDVGVVVPAYRPDVDALTAYLDDVRAAVSPATIRVELDAATGDVADRIRDTGVTVNAVPDRRGKGAAITCGFEALDTDVLAFADADGSTPAASLERVVDAVANGADVAVGSRRHPDATVESHQSVLRRRFGDGFAWLARATLGVPIHDFQCGAKALTAAAWTDIRGHVFEAGFAWDFEVVAVADALGYDVVEVPVRWRDHPESTVAPVRTASRALRGSRLHRLTDVGTRTPLVEDHAIGER